MRESFFKSLREAPPVISEARTSGTAMNCSPLRKIVPNGEIQSSVNSTHPKAAAATRYAIPSVSPRRI
jgi:hypothetical protein